MLLEIRDSSNRLAWEEFVELYRPVIYRAAVSRGLQHADALDLLQTVFVAVANSIARWEEANSGGRFRYWLLRVTRNATLNALSRRPRDSPLNGGHRYDSQIDLLANCPQPDADAVTLIDFEYRRELYLKAAKQVKAVIQEDTWLAFELTAVKGLGHEAAARELGKSIGTVYASRSRVMKRLSAAVAQMEKDDRED
ncbi:MAG: sigma-70 family RNA polymerase sigma factor [Fuerstiella sp.]